MEKDIRDGYRVKDLFDISYFKEAVLLGGSAGLERTISRINVMEVPDVIDWVRPGEFLMTTGYPFKHDPEILVTLIGQLAHKGVVALGVKTKRFFESVPRAAIEAADQYGFPLIELPPSTAFSDVVREVMERVLISELKDLSILQGRVQRLSHVLLHGDGLPAFLYHLQLMIRNPVVLLDPLDKWIASPGAEQLCARIDEKEWQKLRTQRELETCILQIGDHPVRVHVTKVPDGKISSYLLLVVENEQESGIVDTLTLNWAARLLEFEISNMQARKKIEAKYFDQFLQDWMAGRLVSAVDLRLRAEACGWSLTANAVYLAGIVSFRDGGVEVKELQELAAWLNWESAYRHNGMKWTVLEGGLTVLLTFQVAAGSPFNRREVVARTVSMLQSSLSGRKISLCLGREVSGQGEVPVSYLDAKRAVEVRRVCQMESDIVRYGDLGIYLLLYRLQGTEELGEFMRLYLRPLIELDKNQQGELLNTLRTYFLCNCNAKETAEKMFVHYNTVNYRLDRIKSELGLRLDDPETKLLLQIAIKTHEIGDRQ